MSDTGGSFCKLAKLLLSSKLSRRCEGVLRAPWLACRREDTGTQWKTLWLSELIVAEISSRGGDKPQARREPGRCWSLTVRFPGHSSSSSPL